MEIIQIKDKDENIIVEFDGIEWKIYSDYDNDESEILDHEIVKETPFYLYKTLEDIGNADKIIREISQKSPELKNLIDNFFIEKKRLEKRIVLYEEYGSGMLDDFTDFLSISGNSKVGYIVETSIEDNSTDDEYGMRNSLGEIMVETSEKVFDAEQLHQAILQVTSDELDRWANIDWTWEEIISNLESRYPKLAKNLEILVEET